MGLGAYWWNEEEKRKTKRKVEILGEGEEHTIVSSAARQGTRPAMPDPDTANGGSR